MPLKAAAPPTTKVGATKVKKTKESFPDGFPHVLVVDDNDMNRKLIKRMLTQMNLPHLEACDGKESIEVLLSARNYTGDSSDPQVGVVLMDLSMPVMDGMEATEVIRSYSDFADLPIIALTAAAVGREKCEEVGMTEYQTKPIKRDLLYKICKRHLGDHSDATNAVGERPPAIQDLLM